MKVGKFAIVACYEEHEVLQIDVGRSLNYIQEVLHVSKNEYQEKLHQTIAWVKEHGSEIADKSFISNNTSVIKKGKKKEFADFLHINYDNDKTPIDFGSAINFKPDKSFDKSFDKIWGNPNRSRLGQGSEEKQINP